MGYKTYDQIRNYKIQAYTISWDSYHGSLCNSFPLGLYFDATSCAGIKPDPEYNDYSLVFDNNRPFSGNCFDNK